MVVVVELEDPAVVIGSVVAVTVTGLVVVDVLSSPGPELEDPEAGPVVGPPAGSEVVDVPLGSSTQAPPRPSPDASA